MRVLFSQGSWRSSTRWSGSAARHAQGHLGSLLVLLLVIVGVVAPSASGGTDAPTRPVIPLDREFTQRSIDRAAERAAERRSAAARERRARSRSAHRGLGRDAALALAKDRHAGLVRRPLGEQLNLQNGQRLVRFLGESSALVDLGDRNTVVTSMVPMALRDGDGDYRPADLDLVADGSGFIARRPLVDVRVPQRPDGRAAVGGGGLGVVPLVGARVAEPALSEGRVFWANAATDTDVLALPVPAGLEVAYMLRSPDAREELTLGLSLPPGAVAQRSLDGAGGVRIVKDGRTVATITRPVAVDASGDSVNVAFALRDGDLAMRVDHRDADVEYPIAVDPVIELEQEWQSSGQSKVGWWTNNVYGWWNYADWDVGAGNGLNIWHDAGYFYPWWRGDWARTTPGNSFIDSLNVRSIQWWLSQSCIWIGISRYAGGAYPWLARYEDCRGEPWTVNNGYYYGVGPMYPSERVEDKNYVALVHHTGTYPEGNRGFHLTHWGNVEIWYSDWTPPTNPTATLPSGWIDPSRNPSNWTVRSTDAGVGVKRLEADGAWTAGIEFRSDHPCTGNFDNLCNTTRIDNGPDYKPNGAHSMSGNFNNVPEGDWSFSARATDLVSRTSGNGSFVSVGRVKIDRSLPGLALSGPLYDRREDLLEAGTYDVLARGTDGDPASAAARRSGVRRIDLLVDDRQVSTTGDRACTRAEASCPLELPYTFNTEEWPGGDHDITVRVTDHVGLTREETFTVYTDVPHSAFDIDSSDGDPSYEAAFAAGQMRDGDPIDPLGLLYPLPGSRQAQDSTGSTRNTRVTWGISDQQSRPFFDARLRSLGLESARLIAEYDVVTEALGNPPAGRDPANYYNMDVTPPGAVDGATPQQRRDHPNAQLGLVDRWMKRVCPMQNGSRQCTLSPLVSFNPDRKVNTYDPNRQPPERQYPSVAEYERSTRAFRQRYPFVRLYTAWNEANCCSALERDPVRAGEYFLNLRAQCGSGCVVGAGDFLDVDNLTDGDEARRYPLINERPVPAGGCPAGSIEQSNLCFDESPTGPRRTYLRAFLDTIGTVRPAAWGIHAYFTGNRLRLDNMRAFVRQTQDDPTAEINSAGANIWLTEQGGLYRLGGRNYEAQQENPESTATGGTRATRAVRFLVGNPDTSNQGVVNKFPRITRFWLYSWRGGFDFDSGLVQRGQPNGSPPITAARNEFWCYRLVTNPQAGDREACTRE